MSLARRQRHKMRLNTQILLTTLSLAIAQVAHMVDSLQIRLNAGDDLEKQYSPSPLSSVQSNNNFNRILTNINPLVASNEQSVNRQFAHSLPLTRQQPDLDNVIESTTFSYAPQASYLAQSASRPSLASPSNCQLPPTWAGKWYQANKEPIRVTNTEISDKGLCRDQKGDKYLFEFLGNSKQSHQTQTPCLMCLVINERHLNVLQYKESSCQPIPANFYNKTKNQLTIDQDHSLLDTICSDITGDAQLESLFRLDTPAIECPISGQFMFTYDSCREPQSSLDSCIDKKQLNFKFSACPDVPGSESKSEVLKCYADWSEGNNYYMIGRLEQASNHQDKGKFRCFVYEKSPDGRFIQMAQSSEESCYGLINANEGPKTLRLSVKPPTVHKCNFPSYIQTQSEDWLSVDNSLIYMFNQDSTKYQVKETKEGNVIEEASCLQQFNYPQANPHQNPYNSQHQGRSNYFQQPIASRRHQGSVASQTQSDQATHTATSRSVHNDVVYLVQITKNCHTTNYCVRFYKRSNGIVQIDYFISTGNDNQCRNAYIGSPQTQIITSTNLEPQRCPFEGAYTIEAPIESDLTYNPSNIFICPRQSFLTAQCDHPSRLRIHSKCSQSKLFTKNLYCLGSWTTNGLVRLLLKDDDRQRYSAWYRDYGALVVSQDGPLIGEQPQAQALQQQLPGAMTRSQQLLSGASNQYLMNSLAPIVDLQIALITPLPIIAKPMQVRLTRRNQCSDLKSSSNHSPFGGQMASMSSSMPSYAHSATASSSGVSSLIIVGAYYSNAFVILVSLAPLTFRFILERLR